MIQTLEIRNFRNLDNYQLKIDKSLVLIEGPNGTGKTSILESIFFAATTKSHRTYVEKDMIQYDKPYLAVKLNESNNIYEIILSSSGKRTSINKAEIKKVSDYIGKFHVVMFAPEDLMLIKGSPSERRYFLDLELMQVSKAYLRYLNIYKKILKQRNALLKKIGEDDDLTFLNILSEQLYDVGIKIYDIREAFILELNKKFVNFGNKYEHFDISITYSPNVTKDVWLKYLKTKQKQDILYKTTMMGIHKDDFTVHYNGLIAKDNASQGTARLIVIELKLAVLEWIKEQTQVDAILLLDDVLSELDLERQKLFLEQLPKNHQVFISSAVPIHNKIEFQKVSLTKEINNNGKQTK